jgi:hypothetical protein
MHTPNRRARLRSADDIVRAEERQPAGGGRPNNPTAPAGTIRGRFRLRHYSTGAFAISYGRNAHGDRASAAVDESRSVRAGRLPCRCRCPSSLLVASGPVASGALGSAAATKAPAAPIALPGGTRRPPSADSGGCRTAAECHQSSAAGRAVRKPTGHNHLAPTRRVALRAGEGPTSEIPGLSVALNHWPPHGGRRGRTSSSASTKAGSSPIPPTASTRCGAATTSCDSTCPGRRRPRQQLIEIRPSHPRSPSPRRRGRWSSLRGGQRGGRDAEHLVDGAALHAIISPAARVRSRRDVRCGARLDRD